MDTEIERELGNIKLRSFLVEKLFLEFYSSQRAMGEKSQQAAQGQAISKISELGYRLEDEFRKSDVWRKFCAAGRDDALKALSEQIDSLKSLVTSR